MGRAIAEGDAEALDLTDEQSAVHMRTDALSGRVVDGWLLESDGASLVDDSGFAFVPTGGDYVMFTWIVNGRSLVRRVPVKVIEHVLRVQMREAMSRNDATSLGVDAAFGCMMESERA